MVPLVSEPGTVADGAETAEAAHEAEVLILDGYHLGAGHRRGLAAHDGLRVGIDDNLETDPSGLDVIVNPAPHARADDYAGRAPLLLLGPSYALLRREVSRLVPVERPVGPARSVVVVMGGADVGGHSLPLSEALLAATDLDVMVMTGIANPRADALLDLERHSSGRRPPARSGAPALCPRPRRHRRHRLGRNPLGGRRARGCPPSPWSPPTTSSPSPTPRRCGRSPRSTICGTPGTDDIATDVATLAADAARRARVSGAGTALVDGRGASRVVDAVLGVTATHEGEPG